VVKAVKFLWKRNHFEKKLESEANSETTNLYRLEAEAKIFYCFYIPVSKYEKYLTLYCKKKLATIYRLLIISKSSCTIIFSLNPKNHVSFVTSSLHAQS